MTREEKKPRDEIFYHQGWVDGTLWTSICWFIILVITSAIIAVF